MIWLITIPLALVMAYSILCLMIDADMGGGGGRPYWVLLIASAAILYVAWFHPIHVSFG